MASAPTRVLVTTALAVMSLACSDILGIEAGTPSETDSGGSAGSAAQGGSAGAGATGGAGGVGGQRVPFLPDYDKRKRITINAEEIEGMLDGFPLALVTNDAVLIGGLEPDGDDLRFTEEDGTTLLPYEIELISQDPPVLTAWVRLPPLQGERFSIYAYYGNEAVPPGQSPSDVFAEYQGVWHMADPLGLATQFLRDSSPEGNHSLEPSMAQAPTMTPGPMGPCYVFDGVENVIVVPDADSLDPADDFTLSAWVNVPNARAGTDYAVLKGSNGVTGYGLRAGTNDWAAHLFDESITSGDKFVNAVFGSYMQLSSSWHLLSVVLTRSQVPEAMTAYLNGQQSGSEVDISVINSLDNARNLQFSHENNAFRGHLDEVRLTDRVRSPEWLRAMYVTVADRDTYYSIGEEELPPPSP